jgi:hypothetical protein
MGPHKGPMMEFGNKYDGSGVPIRRSFSSISFILFEILLIFTLYIGIEGLNLKLQGPLWDPHMETGMSDHRHLSSLGFNFQFHIVSLRYKRNFKKYNYQTCFRAKNKYRKITSGAPQEPHDGI